jgi:hypothetical protein
MIVSWSAFADAQQHVIDPGQLAATIEQSVAKQDADRAAIREALARSQVREVATNIGVDLAKVSAAVDTLSGYELTRAGEAARQINEQLVGGASTVVISTTTIIIVLLLLILLIVVIR